MRIALSQATGSMECIGSDFDPTTLPVDVVRDAHWRVTLESKLHGICELNKSRLVLQVTGHGSDIVELTLTQNKQPTITRSGETTHKRWSAQLRAPVGTADTIGSISETAKRSVGHQEFTVTLIDNPKS